MKVLMKKVETISYFPDKGYPQPLRFRIKDENDKTFVVKLDQVNYIREDKKAGNLILVYDCQAQIQGRVRLLQLIYDLATWSWYLFKM